MSNQTLERETFTPGPWLSYGPFITAQDWMRPHYDMRICSISNLDCNIIHPTSEVEANTRLIEAAPDLLAACQAALRDVNHPQDIGRVSKRYGQTISIATQQMLREAISKATNENGK